MPNVKNNILHIGQFLERGYDIHMKNCSLLIRDHRSKLIANIKMVENRMFILNIKHEVVMYLNACIKDINWF